MHDSWNSVRISRWSKTLAIGVCLALANSEASAQDAGIRPAVARETAARIACSDESAVLDSAQVQAQAPDPGRPKKKKKWPDVIYIPTPQKVVNAMLELAEPQKGETLYDLGCGDGRIVVTAAKKYRVKGVGYDIDPKRIYESRENVRANDVADLVSIIQADIFEVDLDQADIVTLYLLPELNVKLMPKLRKLKPGTRIVSHDFDMRGAKPEKTVRLLVNGDPEPHTVYLWVVPWEEESSPRDRSRGTGRNQTPSKAQNRSRDRDG